MQTRAPFLVYHFPPVIVTSGNAYEYICSNIHISKLRKTWIYMWIRNLKGIHVISSDNITLMFITILLKSMYKYMKMFRRIQVQTIAEATLDEIYF